MSVTPPFTVMIHFRNGEVVAIPEAEKVFSGSSVQGIANQIFNGPRVALNLSGGKGLIVVPGEISYIELASVS